MRRKVKKRTWMELDTAEKLGYVWTLLYALLIIGTASAIIYPAYKKWQAEQAGGKQGILRICPDRTDTAHSLKDFSNGLARSDNAVGESGSVSLRA